MNWLLLILSLPTENSAARMRAWRALKTCGAVVLRDGVYALPDQPALRATLETIASDVETAGGHAHVMSAQMLATTHDAKIRQLFDRTAEYTELAAAIETCLAHLNATTQGDAARQVKKLGKTLAALVEIDFFANTAQAQTRTQLGTLQRTLAQRLSPDEPCAQAHIPSTCQLPDYQGRAWATRRRPWVDRLASAWLIQRHIDTQARFVWLATPTDYPVNCPADALGFDFDGAPFTHTQDPKTQVERVSFETLQHSFGLVQDAALNKLAQLVHFLDVGGLPVAEAAGVETLLAGMRNHYTDDDALLAAAAQTFDFLYAQYQQGDMKNRE